jgi:hypothetical protein
MDAWVWLLLGVVTAIWLAMFGAVAHRVRR